MSSNLRQPVTGSPRAIGRLSALGLAVLVALALGWLSPARSTAAAPASATGYLVGQLTGSDHLVDSFGPTYGLTADLAIALAAGGDQDPALSRVVGYLRDHVAAYADPDGTSAYPGPYSGAIGKLAVLAEITGQNPRAFGGFDLLAHLSADVCTAPDKTGACTAPGDFIQAYSTVSQSLGVLALARGGVNPPPTTVVRLASLQCADGGFTSTLIVVGDACTSDVDTTGYALQALLAVPGEQAVTGRAESYLLNAQQADGSYLGTAGANSNSTALAAQALLAVPQDAGTAAAISSAKAFLTARQNSDGGFGVSAAKPVSDLRASTQAVPALAGATLLTLSDPITLSGPSSSAPPSSPAASSSAPASTSAPASSAPASSAPARTSSAASSAVAGANAALTGGPELAATGNAPAPALWLALLLLGGGAVTLTSARRSRLGRRH